MNDTEYSGIKPKKVAEREENKVFQPFRSKFNEKYDAIQKINSEIIELERQLMDKLNDQNELMRVLTSLRINFVEESKVADDSQSSPYC